MNNKDEAPKAIAVYDSVLYLLSTKSNIAGIKVADIAQRASIGKGTIYEYFKSKDEIIVKAIVYGYKKLLISAVEACAAKKGLEGKLRALFELAWGYPDVNLMAEFMMKISAYSREIQKDLKEAFVTARLHQLYFGAIIDDLKRAGREDGSINPELEEKYTDYVLMSVLQRIGGPISQVTGENERYTKEEQFGFLYQMVIKALS